MIEIFEGLAPNAGLIFILIVFFYKENKANKKERKEEAEKEAARRKEETNRLINAHSENYNKIQITLNDYLEEFAEMRKDLEIVKTDQKIAAKERTEMLKVLQKHDVNFTKLELKIENFDLRNQLGEKSA